MDTVEIQWSRMFDVSPLVSRVFQRVTGLTPTGELDEATLDVMRKPRCGIEDPFNKKHHRYRVLGETRKYLFLFYKTVCK